MKKIETGIDKGMHKKRKINNKPRKVVIRGLSKAIKENKDI
jgi:hypothetical protein